MSGNLYFGDFPTTFNPAAVPNGGIGAATQNGSVRSTILNLATNLGKIPGMPNHTFGTRFSVEVLAIGDCLFSGGQNPVPVNFNPPVAGAADIDSALNIKYLRSGILLPQTGRLPRSWWRLWQAITTYITTVGPNNRYDAATTPPALGKNCFRLRRR